MPNKLSETKGEISIHNKDTLREQGTMLADTLQPEVIKGFIRQGLTVILSPVPLSEGLMKVEVHKMLTTTKRIDSGQEEEKENWGKIEEVISLFNADPSLAIQEQIRETFESSDDAIIWFNHPLPYLNGLTPLQFVNKEDDFKELGIMLEIMHTGVGLM